uniref:Protein kinase domain-containing protein n=1 Tax=Plectus sambesii TaxID=2011161 RepID=A0A914XP42_9BILA
MQKINEDTKQQLMVEKRKNEAARETIRKLLIEQSSMERKQIKAKCMEESLRLGQFKPERHGEHFRDVWSDGYAFEEMQKKLQKITNERNEIMSASSNLRKRKPSSSQRDVRRQQQQAAAGVTQLNCTPVIGPSTSALVSLPSTSGAYSDDGFVRPDPPKELTLQEYHEQEEIYRLRKEHLKKEEAELLSERDRMERGRALHIRELKRVQYEEASRYKDHVLLNSRYLLLSLLGKGGFSEVWRAFDLDENRYVACKIHD